MRHCLVAIDQRQQGAGGKGAEDRLEPDVLRDGDKADQEHERATDANLRGRVLKSEQDSR